MPCKRPRLPVGYCARMKISIIQYMLYILQNSGVSMESTDLQPGSNNNSLLPTNGELSPG